MLDDYIAYPSTVKELAKEIVRITDDYRARRISNDEIKEAVLWYANSVPLKLFDGTDYNPTVKKIIGQRRIELLDALLVGYQQRIWS